MQLVSLDGDAPPIVLATRQGVVKRVAELDFGRSRELDILSLKPGDEVVSAGRASDEDELVFVSSDSSLLHFAASKVRPQGRSAAGMAGIRLADGASLIHMSTVRHADLATAHLVTIARSDESDDPGSAKVTPLSEYPAKGRATGGVRSHRFIRGETHLALALIAAAPLRANAQDGAQRQLPELLGKRDGSGIPLDATVQALGVVLGDETTES